MSDMNPLVFWGFFFGGGGRGVAPRKLNYVPQG